MTQTIFVVNLVHHERPYDRGVNGTNQKNDWRQKVDDSRWRCKLSPTACSDPAAILQKFPRRMVKLRKSSMSIYIHTIRIVIPGLLGQR